MIEDLKNRRMQQYDWPIFKVVPVIVVEYHVDPDLKNSTNIDQEPLSRLLVHGSGANYKKKEKKEKEKRGGKGGKEREREARREINRVSRSNHITGIRLQLYCSTTGIIPGTW